MKKLISLTVVIVLIMLGPCRFAMADRVAICSSHANKRIITLDYLVDGSQLPCQVVYEKPTERPGYRKILWRAKNSSGYCERKMDAFLRRLDGYGWQCAYEKQDEMPSTEESEPRPVSNPPDKPALQDEPLRQDQDGLAICHKNANKRILNLDYLVKDSPLPCQVVYKKPTEKPSYRKVLWRAKKTVGYCERKLKGFIRNLEKSGWRCSYQPGTITAIVDNPPPNKPSKKSEITSGKQDKPVSDKPITPPPKSAEIVRLEDSYKAYCGEQQINLQKPLIKIAKALSGLKHDSSQLQDCSGIFHKVVRKFKREYCPNYDYPDVKNARETRKIAKWYHEQGELILVHDPLEKSPLIKPGAVMFYGYGGRQNQDFKAENLFIPKLGINHVGVVVSVVRDAKNQVMRYKLFHGREPGKPSKVTDYHPRKQTRSYYPPFGNGKEQWVAIAPLVKQFKSTPSGKSGRVVVQYGEASYYADSLHGNLTANGERYDKDKLTAAHQTLAFGTRVKVTYLKTDQSVEVVINDRGPFSKKRLIDLSRQAAKQVGLIKEGHGRVKMEILK